MTSSPINTTLQEHLPKTSFMTFFLPPSHYVHPPKKKPSVLSTKPFFCQAPFPFLRAFHLSFAKPSLSRPLSFSAFLLLQEKLSPPPIKGPQNSLAEASTSPTALTTVHTHSAVLQVCASVFVSSLC